MTLTPGSQLGPYQIVSQLGQGGMGVVYEARDPRLKRTVAIKLGIGTHVSERQHGDGWQLRARGHRRGGRALQFP